MRSSVSTGVTFSFTRIGIASLHPFSGQEHELELTWNDGYGGGLFVAFPDATSGEGDLGGGRYLNEPSRGPISASTAQPDGRARLQLRLQPVVRL